MSLAAAIRYVPPRRSDLKRQIWAKRLQYIPQSYERLIDIALGVQLDQVWFFRRMNVQAHLWNLLRIIVSHSAGGYMRPHRCARYLNELYRLGLSANGSSHSGDVLYAVQSQVTSENLVIPSAGLIRVHFPGWANPPREHDRRAAVVTATFDDNIAGPHKVFLDSRWRRFKTVFVYTICLLIVRQTGSI